MEASFLFPTRDVIFLYLESDLRMQMIRLCMYLRVCKIGNDKWNLKHLFLCGKILKSIHTMSLQIVHGKCVL